jgi:hypothetical protein
MSGAWFKSLRITSSDAFVVSGSTVVVSAVDVGGVSDVEGELVIDVESVVDVPVVSSVGDCTDGPHAITSPPTIAIPIRCIHRR